VDFFKENGHRVGFKDICKWWLYHYPEDIFVSAPLLVCEVRDRMKLMLKQCEGKKQ
jgi:hypothetical protein